MYRILAASMVVCLVLTGCGGDKKSSAPGGGQASNSGAAKDAGAQVNEVALEGYTIGEPVRHANLTIYPVLSKEPRNDDRYITLDEGLANGTVEIVEVGAAEEVAAEQDEPSTVSLVASAVARLLGSQEDAGDPFSEEDVLPTRRSDYENPFGGAPNVDPFAEAPNPPAQQPAPQIDEGQQAAVQEDLDLQFRQERFSQGERADEGEPQIAENFDNQVGGYGGNQVNTLLIVNRGEKPLYVMPGEVIIGGSQDRTIGREFIVQNDGQPIPIDVFCVEHDRWGGRDEAETVLALSVAMNDRRVGGEGEGAAAVADFDSLQALETASLVEDVNRGKFVASVGQLSKDARVAVVKSGDQSEVWNKVAIENAKAGVNPDSGAFTANYTDAEAVARFEEYIEKLKDPIAGQPRVVGVIVAINGKVETADVFESTPLFQKLWPKLLKSYALDAANVVDGEEALAHCPSDRACDFLKEVLACPGEAVHQGQGIAVTRGEGENVFTTNLYSRGYLEVPIDGQPAAPDGRGVPQVGGFGGSVHASGFAQ